VGVVAPSYGSEKLSYGLDVPGYSYRKVTRIPFHRFEQKTTFWRYSAFVLDNSVNLIHTNNHIPFSTQPFVLSFENELPRNFGEIKDWMTERSIKRLRSDKCKKILGMSSVAANLAKENFHKLGYPEIANKVDVFRGGLYSTSGQPQLKDKKRGGPLKLLFVGRSGFSKGIIPTITAVEVAQKKGIDVQLTIISKFSGGNYVLKEFMPEAKYWKKRILSHSFIEWFEAMPNHAVREAMRSHDLLVFPSFDETLGWVVVEAALEGTPAVVTNIFAFPELVDDNISGSIIPLDLGKQQRWKGIWLNGQELAHEIEKANNAIHNNLLDLIDKLSSTPLTLLEWGSNAREKLTKMYDPVKAAQKLASIYDKAMEP
jgi:glycosyltransferase involved in cell wall biosynthesis